MLVNLVTVPCEFFRPKQFERWEAFWFQEERPEIGPDTFYDTRTAFAMPARANVRSLEEGARTTLVWSSLALVKLLVCVLAAELVEPRVALLGVYFFMRALYCARPSAELGRGVWFAHCLGVPLCLSSLAAPVLFGGGAGVWVTRVVATLLALLDVALTRTMLLWPHVMWCCAFLGAETVAAAAAMHVHPALCVLSLFCALVCYGTTVTYDINAEDVLSPNGFRVIQKRPAAPQKNVPPPDDAPRPLGAVSTDRV